MKLISRKHDAVLGERRGTVGGVEGSAGEAALVDPLLAAALEVEFQRGVSDARALRPAREDPICIQGLVFGLRFGTIHQRVLESHTGHVRIVLAFDTSHSLEHASHPLSIKSSNRNSKYPDAAPEPAPELGLGGVDSHHVREVQRRQSLRPDDTGGSRCVRRLYRLVHTSRSLEEVPH